MAVSARKSQQSAAVGGPDAGDRLSPCREVLEDDFAPEAGGVGHLQPIIKRAPEQQGVSEDVTSARVQPQSRHSLQNLVSKNPRMVAIFDLIDKVAQTTATVLIEGETGTGKEQIARAVHQASRARSGPLVPVSGAALSEHLLESELFGHEKGAFTSIWPEDLASELVRPDEGKARGRIDWSRPLAEVVAAVTDRIERRYLLRAMKRSRGSVGRCAKLCGLCRRSMTSKLAKYRIDRSEFTDT